ncbi:LexA family transcriptional regulator [Fulvivirgaceae bacterium BMA10]|uniref:LexA family transcriptional regulator n=1 Tax=Splendidivirga corallicola TaxID=3051826 RepID=A0ABT8KR84_9BACT|nr:LexA family transcriptional regulator [Fulvivirgaceae bacterium BMA10]
MTLVSKNIKYLRKLHAFTQEQFSEKIGIKRSLLGAYEEGRADPRLNNLLNMAKEFGVSVDVLISQDVTGISRDDLKVLGQKEENGEGLKILSITVDKDDNENIELVPQKASAGYLNGYSDPEYLQELPKFQLPNLPQNGTYRAFELSGDSMLPLVPGTIVIGKYLESAHDIKSGKTYVLVSKQEGVVYKRVFNYLDENGKLFLVSDNKIYAPYEVDATDILEIWEAKAFISVSFPDPEGDMTLDKLTGIVMDLQQEVIKLKDK